jgi:broad-specificity NMP kinase
MCSRAVLRMSIIIIEGADGTGKTRYARALAKENKAGYLHKNKPQHDTWRDEYIKPLERFEDRTVVCDRWHVGEMIWPLLFERTSLFIDRAEYKRCCQVLACMGARVEILYRDPSDIKATLTKRGEIDQLDTVLRSQDMFLHVASITHDDMPVRVIDSNVIYEERAWR